MITYVNDVFVSNLSSNNIFMPAQGHMNPTAADAGKFVVVTLDENPAKVSQGGRDVDDPNFPYVDASTANKYNTIKIGLITSKVAPQIDYATGAKTDIAIINWSNKISVDSIKSYANSDYTADTEDTISIDFTNVDDNTLARWAEGGKRILVRLTFKDMPHRYRKWTETYEYLTKEEALVDATAKTAYKKQIVSDIVNLINKQYKRARITASKDASDLKIVLTAMLYDDDNVVDSISWYNKVRFNANIYWTDPAAEGWESTNKYFPEGVSIDKVPGKTYVASAKLVRDREAQSFGYDGILNRGEGTWPIIKPDMNTKLDGHYDAMTLEFERLYRSADDLQRRTKECIEAYAEQGGLAGLRAIVSAFIG